MTETINYLRRCADNRVLEASLTPYMCREIVQMCDGLAAERARLERPAEAGEPSTEQLPDGLKLAVDLLDGDRDAFVACHIHPVHGLEPGNAEIAGEYIGAIASIRAEHAKRVTMQHYAAGLAKRVADLEAERDAALAELERAREVLREVEWVSDEIPYATLPDYHRCPSCWAERREGHASDCKLNAAMAKGK